MGPLLTDSGDVRDQLSLIVMTDERPPSGAISIRLFSRALEGIVTGCEPPDCKTYSGRRTEAELRLWRTDEEDGAKKWGGRLDLGIDGFEAFWRSNGSNLTLALPSAFMQPNDDETSPDDMVPERVGVLYAVPDAERYLWTGALQPDVDSDEVVFVNDAHERLPGQVTAVNPDVEASDRDRTFFSGVLVGAAAGAAIGALELSMEARRRRHS